MAANVQAELADLARALEELSALLPAAIADAEPDRLELLVAQYQELVGRAQAIARQDPGAVLRCAPLAEAVRREQDLLALALQRRHELQTELVVVQQEIAVVTAYETA